MWNGLIYLKEYGGVFDLIAIEIPNDITERVRSHSTHDRNVLAFGYGQVHRSRRELRGTSKLGQDQTVDPNTKETSWTMANGFHWTWDIALREPKAKTSLMTITGPSGRAKIRVSSCLNKGGFRHVSLNRDGKRSIQPWNVTHCEEQWSIIQRHPQLALNCAISMRNDPVTGSHVYLVDWPSNGRSQVVLMCCIISLIWGKSSGPLSQRKGKDPSGAKAMCRQSWRF